jgi:transcriptional regulator with XRE-family HTH domain
MQHHFAKVSSQRHAGTRTLQPPMSLNPQEIHERIRNLRAARGLPQPAVASEVGVSLRALQFWESDDPEVETVPRYGNLERLAGYYGVSEEYILTGRENSVPESPVVMTQRVEDVREEFQRHVQAMRDDVSRVHADLQRVLRNQTAIMRELGIRASGEGAEPVVAYPESDRRRGERRHGS